MKVSISNSNFPLQSQRTFFIEAIMDVFPNLSRGAARDLASRFKPYTESVVDVLGVDPKDIKASQQAFKDLQGVVTQDQIHQTHLPSEPTKTIEKSTLMSLAISLLKADDHKNASTLLDIIEKHYHTNHRNQGE